MTQERQQRDRATVRAWSLHKAEEKKTGTVDENERLEGREVNFLLQREQSSSFKISAKHLHAESILIKVWSKCDLTAALKEMHILGIRQYSWFLSWCFVVGLSRHFDGNEHGRWFSGPIDTCAGPWALQRSPSSSSVIPSSLPWFPHLVYYYSIIASICLSSHRVDWDQEQKTVRARMKKEGRIFFFTPIQTHPLPALSSSHSPSSEQIKMLRSHFSLSVQEIIIQTDFWTASCTIRNSAALGRKMWFKLVLYCITIYSWSRLPSHTPSVSLQGCLVRVFVSVWMHECTYKYNVYTHPGIYFVSYINFLWPLQDCQL